MKMKRGISFLSINHQLSTINFLKLKILEQGFELGVVEGFGE